MKCLTDLELQLEICIGQSWYLSNDFQFFVFAPIFIWLLYKSPKIGKVDVSKFHHFMCVLTLELYGDKYHELIISIKN